MNTNRILLSMLLLLVCLIGLGFADKPVPLGVSFLSPDSQYSVKLEQGHGMPVLVIQNLATGQADTSIVPNVVLYLHWAANSRSFVTVEHVPKGSRGRVIYQEGNKWRDVEVEPPLKGQMDCTVVKLQLVPDHVHYKFAVTNLAPNWTPIDYWFCDLDVSLGTGKVSNVKWTPISQAEWAAALWPHKPVYLPPMTAGQRIPQS